MARRGTVCAAGGGTRNVTAALQAQWQSASNKHRRPAAGFRLVIVAPSRRAAAVRAWQRRSTANAGVAVPLLLCRADVLPRERSAARRGVQPAGRGLAQCAHAPAVRLRAGADAGKRSRAGLLFSKPYALAMCVACVEYAAETALAPALKVRLLLLHALAAAARACCAR